MADQEGHLIADTQIQASLLTEYWSAIHSLPDGKGTLSEELLQLLPTNLPWCPDPLQPTDVAAALAAMKMGTSCRPDGWRTAELRALPSRAVHELTAIIGRCEALCAFPDSWMCSLTSTIPRSATSLPTASQLRPIAVFSLLWRIYAKAKFTQLSQAYNASLHPWQHGGRTSCKATTPVVQIMGVVEATKQNRHCHVHGISIDIEKMFDTIPHNVLIQIWHRWQMDETCIATLLKHLRDSTCRYKLAGGFVSDEIQITRGVQQGCPLAVFAANSLGVVIDIVQSIFEQLGMTMSCSKSCIWTTSPTQSKKWNELGNPFGIKQVHALKILGGWIHLRGPRQQEQQHYTQALQVCKARAERISTLPIGRARRSTLVSSMILPKLTYMPTGHWLTINQQKMAETQMTKAVKGGTLNNRESREMDFILFRPMHRHHVASCRFIRLLSLLQECYAIDPVSMLMAHLHMVSKTTIVPCGVLSTLWTCALKLGLRFDGMDLCNASEKIPLFHAHSALAYGAWCHGVRALLRTRLCALLVSRRHTYQGIEGAGVNRKASTPLIRDPHVAAWRHVWNIDGLMTQMRLLPPVGGSGSVTDSRSPPLCSRCALKPDDLAHRLWECPAVAHLRCLEWQQVKHLPACVVLHGVIPNCLQLTPGFVVSLTYQAFGIFQAYTEWSQDYANSLRFHENPLPPIPTFIRHTRCGGGSDAYVGAGAVSGSKVCDMTDGKEELMIGHHAIYRRPSGAWECRGCARMRSDTWAKIRATFEATPCRIVHESAGRQAPEVRLATQRFLNDVKEHVTGDALYALGGDT